MTYNEIWYDKSIKDQHGKDTIMYKAIPYNPFDKHAIYLDVRSPSEYLKGHIPNALNIPILDDAQRHEVGSIYKMASVDEAKAVGIRFGSQKLDQFYHTISELKKEKPHHKIIFYCARGGYRSKSVALFMRGIDVPVYWLSGGYKAYRQCVLKKINDADDMPRFIVLNGLSGVGKTHVLKCLQQLGAPIIDLEGAANHKGSHLGAIGTDEVQTMQSFENTLYQQLTSLQNNFCFVESESKRIGHVCLPNALYNAMQNGQQLLLQATFEYRLHSIIEDYSKAVNFRSLIKPALEKIKPYLSNALYQKCCMHLERNELNELATLLMTEHYDPIYEKSIGKHSFAHTFTNDNPLECAHKILDQLNI